MLCLIIGIGEICSKIHVHQQLCLAHGLQLAITDVLYDKPKESENTDDEESESEDEINDNFDDILFFAFDRKEIKLTLKSSYNQIISKVREVCKFFNCSKNLEGLEV